MIFEHLPSRDIFGCVRHVCPRWAALVEPRALCVDQLEDIDRMNRRVRSVRILVRTPLRVFLLFTPKVAPYLRDLTIYAVSPFGPEHFTLLNNIQHLEHLDIFLRDRVLDIQLLPVILKLKSLVINEIISNKVLRALAAGERLRALYMYGRSLYYPRKELLILLRTRKHHLRELVLRCNELHDASYAAIGQCDGLTSLQLYSCWLMTGAGILSATRPRQLRRLHITGARMVRTRCLSTFLDRIPQNVEELVLSMSWFGDEHIAPLIHRLPSLRVLELWKCRLTARGAITLAETLTSLRFLDLDIMLTNGQIRKLDKHPSLLFVRCLTEFSVQNNPDLATEVQSKRNVEKPVTNNIKVIATDERYPFKYFRGGGEGYRASLYYYWTQDVALKPITNSAIPAFESEDEYY